MRWLLIDEFVSIEKGNRAIARSRVPQTCYSPELLMVEMMAQAGAVLLGAEVDFAQDLVFAKIESAEFEEALPAGTVLEVEASSGHLRSDGAWFDCSIRAGGVIKAKAKILLMVVGHFSVDSRVPKTFHTAFMEHFQIRRRIRI